jgi:hypothetical protein
MKKIAYFLSVISLGLVFNTSVYSEGVLPAPAAVSTVSGKVVDLNSGETLAGVAVSIEGTDTKVYTDLDGNFTIKDIKPGVYNLVFFCLILYLRNTSSEVEIVKDECSLLIFLFYLT